MKQIRVSNMWLRELIKFMLSEQFRKSDWASECLFPPINRDTIANHPLVVAERVTARKKAALPVMIMSLLIISCGLYGVDVLGERTTDGLVYLFCLLGAYLATFILGCSFLQFLMLPEEKQTLRSCRDRWSKWEQLTEELLTVSIQRAHSSMEHIVEEELVKTAKQLIKIERENALSREAGNLSSFSLDLEKRARQKMEDFHGLVRYTNLVVTSKWDIYFKKAEEALDEEEAEKNAEQEKRGKPVCEGCGGP